MKDVLLRMADGTKDSEKRKTDRLKELVVNIEGIMV